MTEWKEYKLGDLIETNAKSIGKGYPYSKILYLDTGSITCNKIESLQECEIGEAPSRAKRMVRKEDIIYSSVRPDQLHYGFIKNPQDNLVVSTGFVTITCNKAILYPKFLYYYLIQSQITEYLHSVAEASTTAYPSLRPSDIEALDIEIPPIDEQKRIAGVLSSLDDKIDLLHRENATLEALAETLFRHYFIENPDPTWKEGKIADLVDFNPNRKLTKNEDSPYFEMANIETQGYAPSSWRMRPFASGTKFINGDAIMARISPCLENGKAAYIDFLEDGQVGWGSTEFLVMRSKMGLHPFFAYIMTRYDDFRDHAVSSLVGSSGRQRVDLDNLLKYSIFIPDEKAITRFNREMEMIVSKMRNNQLQMRTLAFQRDIILPRLMSGEVKVIGL